MRCSAIRTYCDNRIDNAFSIGVSLEANGKAIVSAGIDRRTVEGRSHGKSIRADKFQRRNRYRHAGMIDKIEYMAGIGACSKRSERIRTRIERYDMIATAVRLNCSDQGDYLVAIGIEFGDREVRH